MFTNMVYILPMILGRTFDSRTDQVGVDIFPPEALADIEVKPATYYRSFHKVVNNAKDVQDLLEIDGDLSLKIKMGSLEVKGVGNYLKETARSTNMIEILTKSTYVTVEESLKSKAKPLPRWSDINPADLGTHYVSSIKYGGFIIASLRFKAKTKSDKTSLEALINTAMAGKGLDDFDVSGKLQKISQEFNQTAKMEISYYASVPLKTVPNTILGLHQLITGFKEQIDQMENKKGKPIEVGLTDLSFLDPSRPPFVVDSNLKGGIKVYEDYLDDLNQARSTLVEWVRSKFVQSTQPYEDEIEKLLSRMEKVKRQFYETMGELDVTKSADQLLPIKNAYYENKAKVGHNRFSKEVDNLIKKLNDIIEEPKVQRPGAVTYIHWGRTTCNVSVSESVGPSGHVVSGLLDGIGGAVDYLCLSPAVNTTGFQARSEPMLTKLGGATYSNYILGGKGVPCSRCRAAGRAGAEVLPMLDICPQDWHQAYRGRLMAAPDNGYTSSYICVDASLEGFDATPDQSDPTLTFAAVNPAPGFPYVKQKSYVPCIVCLQ